MRFQNVRGRSQPRATRLFLTLCTLMLVVALLSQQEWASGLRGAAKSLLAPVEVAMTLAVADAEQVTSVLGDISSLRAENARLRLADAALRRQVVELNAAAQENAALRQALDFEKASGRRMVAAHVIGRGPDAFSTTLEIDRGTADGVRAGMVVVTGAGLLGSVREAGPHAAIVDTLADPRSRINVFLSTSNLEGVVFGGAAILKLRVAHPSGVRASTGEWALTSGIGGAYPRGLVVGEIANLTRLDSPLMDDAALAWVNDPASLTMLLVITDFTPVLSQAAR